MKKLHFQISINTRTLNAKRTGIQRYTESVIRHFPSEVQALFPSNSLMCHGVLGHIWEQSVLPLKTRGNLLWSPANTGPLVYVKQVVTVHDLNPIENPQWVSPMYSSLYKTLMPRLLGSVRKVICVSEYTRNRIMALYPYLDSEKIVVITEGVDTNFVPIDNYSSQAELFGNYNLKPKKYILSVCTLEPRKNLKLLLEAWADLLPLLPPDLTLALVGGVGNERVFGNFGLGTLPDRVNLLGRVSDNDLPSLYSSCLAFIYPSLYEGFGLPPLEAMACGAPVICSNSTSIPEVVGDAGMLFNPLKKSELITCILDLLKHENLRLKFRNEGIERAKLFSWQKASHKTWDILVSESTRL